MRLKGAFSMIDSIKRNHAHLHGNTIPRFFEKLSEAQLRARPTATCNSIAWNIWHLLRIEDITLSRFVANVPQVHAQSDWTQRLAIPYGDMGTAMPIADVEVLSHHINLAELKNYAAAVAAQGTSSLAAFDASRTGQHWDEAHMRAVVIGESVCIPAIAEGVVSYWGNLTIDQFVVNYTTLHPSLHVGEIGVLAGLQGVNL
jgi:hypothetical protein